MSAPEGWHPDPTGRHQLRWWDGSTWTDWVTTDGRTAQDPVQAAPQHGSTASAATATASGAPDAAQVEHLLSQPRLAVEIGGGTFASPGWRTIADGAQQPVGRIHRDGRTATVCDLNGVPFLEASARRVGRGSVSERSVGDLRVTSGGQTLATVSFVQAKAITFRFHHHDGQQDREVLVCRIERSFRGVVEGGTLSLPDGRPVGSLTEFARETSGMVLRSWILVDKVPDLPEPCRSLAVAAPLVFDVFTNPVGPER